MRATRRTALTRLFLLWVSIAAGVPAAGAEGPQPTAAKEPWWVQATPFGGPISELEQAPSSADTLYAVTDNGNLFVSTDGARTWSARSSPGDGTLQYAAPGSLVVDPRHADTLYAFTGQYPFIGSLLRSVDGGRSWTLLNLEGALSLTFDRENPLQIWAGTLSGLCRSTDQGAHWEVVAFQNLAVNSFVIDPFDAQSFVLSLADGSAWRSTDGGLTWQPTSCSSCYTELFDVAHRGVIYAFGKGAQPAALTRSLDGGRSWSLLPIGDIGDLASSTDGTLYAASKYGFGVLASHDLGSRWLPRPTDGGFGDTDPADFIRRVLVSPSSPEVLLAAGTQGIWRSTDRGASWRLSNEGVVNLNIDMVWADPSGRPGVFATGVNGPEEILHSSDGGVSWRVLAKAYPCFFDDPCDLPDRLLAADPRARQIMYGSGFDGQADYLSKSTEGGRNWSKLPFPIACCYSSQDGLEMTAFYLDPTHPETVFVAGDYHFQYGGSGPFLTRSDDGGRQWRELGPPTEQAFLGLVGGPPGTLYGLSCDGIFVSKDLGETWQATGQGLPAHLCPSEDTQDEVVASYPGLPLLLSDPQEPRILYVGTPGEGIYRSADGGSSFEPFGHGLETATVESLVVDPANPERIYAGLIGQGVYGWNALLDAWTPLNAGLPIPYFTGIVTLEGTDPPALYAIGSASGSVYRLLIP